MKPTRVSCWACCQSRSATDESRAAQGGHGNRKAFQFHKPIGTVSKLGGKRSMCCVLRKDGFQERPHHSRQSCFFSRSTRLQIANGVTGSAGPPFTGHLS